MTRSSRPPSADRTFEAEEPTTGSQRRLSDRPDAPNDRATRAVREIHVLFVDDDPLAEMTLRRAFRRLGIDGPLTIAHDGLEALEVLRDPWFPIDRCVILLDLNM